MLKIGLSTTGLSVGEHRVHYAWVIVAVASAMWLTSSSIRIAASMLVPYLADSDGFGWSYGAIALAFSIQWLFAGLFGPAAGWLGDRYGVRRTMILGAFLFVAGMMLTGTMTHLWEFYLYFGIILSASMAIFQVPLVAAVSTWFKKHLGLAMGALQGSQGIGTAIAILLIVVLFNTLGLKWTFWIPGIAGGLVLLMLTRIFHNEPGEVGLRPLGASENEAVEKLQKSSTAKIRTSVFLRQAQRTNAFWNLVGIHFWGCAGHNIILVFLVAMAVDQGMSQGLAAGFFITLTIVSTITRFLVPVVADRVGSKWAMLVSFSLQTFPVLILFVAQDTWTFYLFAVIFGIGLGGEMTAFPIINRQYYGNAPLGTAYGWQIMGGGVGMALGPWAGGFIRDLTGDFTGAIALSFGLSLIGVLSILFLPATSRRLIPRWEEALPPEARSSASP